MEYEDFNLIYNELAQKHNIKIHINTPDSVVVPYKEYPKYSIHEATLNNIPVVSMNYEDINENINFCKVMLIDEPELIEEVITKIPKEFHDKYTIVRSAPFFLEFLNKETNKGKALKALCEYLNIDPSEVMAIGDEENDLSMLEYAGYKIAMDNANVKLKNIATYITASNNDEGVGKVVEKLVLNKL
jgi:Cof subfamily protein (haloacid dehalogenase superfamily)